MDDRKPEAVLILRSSRVLDLVVGVPTAALGALLTALGADVPTRLVGILSLAAGLLISVRRRVASIEDDALVLRSYVRTKRYRWDEIAWVTVDGPWMPFRLIRLSLSNGRIAVLDGVGTFRRHNSHLDTFVAAASGLACGPQPARTEPMPRRTAVLWATAFLVVIGLIVLGNIRQDLGEKAAIAVIVVCPFAYWVVTLLSLVRLPAAQFEAAGTSKGYWVMAVALFGIFGALVWLIHMRDRVTAARLSP